MRMNASMRRLLEGLSIDYRQELPDDAAYVLESGWQVGPQGALLLRALWGSGWGKDINPAELGNYEYEVNDVYVPLRDLAVDMDTYLSKAVSRTMSFTVRMLEQAKTLPEADKLLSLVSVAIDIDSEDFLLQGGIVRFFTTRGNYPSWLSDLEGFELEALALLHLDDIPLKPA